MMEKKILLFESCVCIGVLDVVVGACICEKQESRSGLFHLEPNAKRPKAPSHRETLHVQILTTLLDSGELCKNMQHHVQQAGLQQRT